jgi:glycosyltransferase involved in cell wall biosynthesis
MNGGDAYRGRRVAVLAPASVSGEVGGAERLYAGLHEALLQRGCAADLVTIPHDESTFDRILAGYEHCRALDLSHYELVISTKAPTFAVRHPRHVVYLVHTVRVFYDMFDAAFPSAGHDLREQRRQLQRLDTDALASARCRFAIGHQVAVRLRRWNRLDAEVLHPPLGMNRFRSEHGEGYFFLPGRLHPWKRVDLAIRAVQGSSRPLRLLIAGTGEAEAELKALAAGDPRIDFLGRISDDALVEYYARCLAVPFVPVREDYGYVTLEAFASGKPVITCTDSGEPVQFVAHGQNGWICDPTPESLREAMEECFLYADRAAAMGMRGREAFRDITWPNVAQRLLQAGFGVDGTSRSAAHRRGNDDIRVAVLDMQPIEPAVGGGRLRLRGLYHALGAGIRTRYVGSYDWPGERLRRQQLTSTLEEVVVPLSDAHHAAARRLASQAGGKVVIDIAFARLGHLSADYLRVAREAVDWADVVVFSHPWVYPLVADRVRQAQLVVYDAQNVEGFLRAQLLDSAGPVQRQLLREVIAAEYQVGLRADLVLSCSAADRERFGRVYEWPFARMRVMPNGVMSSSIAVASAADRREAKLSLGLDAERPAVIFVGSAYGPNVEAAQFIAGELAPAVAEMNFVIAGGVGASLDGPTPPNVRRTGAIDEKTKKQWLRASDFGINPMFSGSGTNIKMFDLMAAGLPTIATAIGARGIERGGRQPFIVVGPDAASFAEALRRLVADPEFAAERSRQARECVDDGYSWEHISPCLGTMLRKRVLHAGTPYFSVVVPTYERHAQLDALMARLEAQTERGFEVIVVDQSSRRWPNESQARGFCLSYVHTQVRGAVRARNTGADCASGRVIAFTDDDCLPEADWLRAARRHFEAASTVGLEGAIESDHLDDPAYRPVTNIGFEGVGFMTANLFVRAEAFHRLNGFDLDFDRPHFREDTDLGWRLQQLGEVPYGRDVRVFHPAQPRALARESELARARYFEKDALLLAKHPRRYRELFEREGHWRKTPGFWEHFERGARTYAVPIDEFLPYKERSKGAG